jgi:hypothetical protein
MIVLPNILIWIESGQCQLTEYWLLLEYWLLIETCFLSFTPEKSTKKREKG